MCRQKGVMLAAAMLAVGFVHPIDARSLTAFDTLGSGHQVGGQYVDDEDEICRMERVKMQQAADECDGGVCPAPDFDDEEEDQSPPKKKERQKKKNQ